jgi:cephalosporin-C deacetylase-like acetyl esterase
MSESKLKLSTVFLCLSVVLMIAGSALARGAQTSFGKVDVEEIEYIASTGAKTVALLYLPEHLSVDSPAPGIVVSHGYTSYNDAIELHPIELAKRGYVVLTIDAYGHGFSTFFLQTDRPRVDRRHPERLRNDFLRRLHCHNRPTSAILSVRRL